MPNELVMVNNCPVCGSGRIAPASNAISSVPFATVDFGYSALRVAVQVRYTFCLMCGMIWQNPRMSDEAIRKYYSEGHYRNSLSATEESMDKDEEERALRILSDIPFPFIPKRHLDIGCSRGYLLEQTHKKFNCVIQGVDMNPSYGERRTPVVDDLKLLVGKYDLITMIHVLEHGVDPVKDLKEVKEYLEPGGFLLIEVPSIVSRGGPFRLAHTLYFDPHALVNVCRLAGFNLVEISQEEHTQILVTH